MSTPTTHLADLVTDLQRTDPGRPRITWYVVDGGPADGERVELSGAVLANWASKAAGLLQDELDAGPGATVLLDLPPHWRTLYWAVAAWHVGATVLTTGSDVERADVVVTADPASAPDGEQVVVVSLPALARRATVAVPAGAVDEARELSSYPDSVVPYARAGSDALALAEPPTTFAPAPGPAGRHLDVVAPGTATGPWLAQTAASLVGGGSVVVVRVATGGRTTAETRVGAIAAQEHAVVRGT